ncbi:hypothetical protein SCB71_21265 (plasmid) [Herbiconiux sp. KACC 21604]|uniref:hypothetical protein n=1 Tax=unclassified Herbiconiux TaxID=2618217 RepID=UPI0014926964|nr:MULTISPECIES: hypothetical protein [unclassified Herbiconiux]QJU56275.1 hypothetical protein HL652_21060 [Herbiconiux sp. SALV-R1]WPO88780.1 hypothetical protein SCB71_21265 [Herbiconiux sp. KACC 21604]
MTDPSKAHEIREQIRASQRQLEQLAADGRIVMTADQYNTDWPDSTAAIRAAVDALDRAAEAMLWMETLPHVDGGYPPITD